MIEPLDNSEIEDGLEAYLKETAAFLALEVPSEDPRVPAGPPDVVKGLDRQEVDAKRITLAISVPDLNQEALGFYQPEVHLWVITPTALQANTRDHHKAVVKALARAFPNRPAPGSAELGAWAAIEASVSANVAAATSGGFRVRGWYFKTGSYGKDAGRWEQRVTLTMGLEHPAVYGGSSSSSGS